MGAAPPQLLPILLPSRRTTPVLCGRLWNVVPAHGPPRTVLDELPTPTDQKVGAAADICLASAARPARVLVVQTPPGDVAGEGAIMSHDADNPIVSGPVRARWCTG